MANSAGVSGPFNPAIGLGGSLGPLVIGVSPANLPAAIAGPPAWGQAALGEFIGVQSANTVEYSDNPPSVDFDSTFIVDVVNNSAAKAQFSYQNTQTYFYHFAAAAGSNAALVAMPAPTAGPAGTPQTLNATVTDASSALVVGATVNFTIKGGSATGKSLSAPSAVTNASGVASVTVNATGPGTADVHASCGAATPADTTATFQ